MRTARQPTRVAILGTAALIALACGGAAADSLSCRSIDGNVTCAAPHARSCQTVDGRTVCTSGTGDAVQIFGGAPSGFPDPEEPDHELPDYELDEATGDLVIERSGPLGRLSLRRENGALHIDTGRLRLDIR